MTDTTTTPGSTPPVASTRIQQVPIEPTSVDAQAQDGWTDEWAGRFATCLWQMGVAPDLVRAVVDDLAAMGLTQQELETEYTSLTRDLALGHLSDAWHSGSQIAQVPQGPPQYPQDPGKPPLPPWNPPQQPPVDPGAPPQNGPGKQPLPTPPWLPPGPQPPHNGPGSPPGKPPGSAPGKPPIPTDPNPIPTPIPDPGQEPGGDGGGSLAPWLIGIGVLGAIGVGAIVHTGSRSRKALTALGAAYDKGGLGQGGIRAIHDAQEGARFARGISGKDLRAVSIPIVNRVGDNARLRSLALGHLDNLELTAAMSATHKGLDGALAVNDDMRRVILADMEQGASLRDALKPLQRDKAPFESFMDDADLIDVWQETAMTEAGTHITGKHVVAYSTDKLPELAIVDRQIVETGSGLTPDINHIQVRRGADMDGRGLAEGVGTTKGLRLGRRPEGTWKLPLESAGIPREQVDAHGLVDAFIDRMRQRYDAGKHIRPVPDAPTPSP